MERGVQPLDIDMADESPLPPELVALRQRLSRMPIAVRRELEPFVDGALEEAWFRGRVLTMARDALRQMRMELEMSRFDLDVTRRENAHVESNAVWNQPGSERAF